MSLSIWHEDISVQQIRAVTPEVPTLPWSNLGHGTMQPADMFASVITRREVIRNESNSGVPVQYL